MFALDLTVEDEAFHVRVDKGAETLEAHVDKLERLAVLESVRQAFDLIGHEDDLRQLGAEADLVWQSAQVAEGQIDGH